MRIEHVFGRNLLTGHVGILALAVEEFDTRTEDCMIEIQKHLHEQGTKAMPKQRLDKKRAQRIHHSITSDDLCQWELVVS